MTNEEKRIAVAEACGWINQGRAKGIKELENQWAAPGSMFVEGFNPPDYLIDLNAMHEAEKSLGGKYPTYVEHLWSIIKSRNFPHEEFEPMPLHIWPLVTAAAAQRAEAFLRTIGRWKD